ncbi:alpha/beta hydrolase [Rubripirellula obstinata]|uniref:alpha/beta hydrolase n=1 Tax=Rubripirellula obstinata TaxID=406547 RepID=UPI001F410AD5|nr:lysophospholipase [Rubripirellula obstinata]
MPTATRQKIGSLNCIVVDGGQQPTVAVIICHGYGASLDDLAPLAGEWLTMLGDDASEFRFVFPDAPHSLAELGMPTARAWWPINMARLAQAVQANSFDDLHDETPPGIDEARAALDEVITETLAGMPTENPRLVLGGFSQGAMLTMDTTLRGTNEPPALLIQFSGTVICRSQWQDAAKDRLSKTKIFQSHGKIDPVLPFDSAVVLRDLLRMSGAKLEFHSFQGPHTIDGPSVEKVALMLADVLTQPSEEELDEELGEDLGDEVNQAGEAVSESHANDR